MPEFLVRTTLSSATASTLADEVRLAERHQGRHLRSIGALKRIWRIPGTYGHIALYDVPNATELHQVLQSLPLSASVEVSVQPLAEHPLEAPETKEDEL